MNLITKKPFISIFFIVFLLNFIYAITYNIKPVVDAEAYDEIATNIVRVEEYRSSLNTPLEMDGAITRVGPGYEFFLAIIYLFFDRNLWLVWFIQAILFGLTICMLGKITLRLFPSLENKRIYVYISMIFVGLLIDIVQINGMLMTESLFFFLLTLSFYIWSKIEYDYPEQKLKIWGLLGFVLGLLTLTRPNGLLIIILITFVSLYKNKSKIIKFLLIMVFFYVLVQLPWFIRNYKVYNQFVFHSATEGLNLFSGNYPGNHGEFNADFPLYKEYKEKYESPIEMNIQAKKWFKKFVIENPIQATLVIAEKITIFFSLAKTSGFWFHYFNKTDQIVTILISIVQNFVILGSILFFIINTIEKIIKKEVTKRDLFIILYISILSLTPIISVIASRHRLPLVIMSLPILAYVMSILNKENLKKQIPKIILVIIILIISTSFDVFLQFDKFKARINRVSHENTSVVNSNA